MGNGITTYFGSYGIIHRTESHEDLSDYALGLGD
jgi:hypothetical protein